MLKSRQEIPGILYTNERGCVLGRSPVRLFTTVAGLRCYLNLHRSIVHAVSSAVTYEASPIGIVPAVGLVPTMGALHTGHLSLIQRARRESKIVVVSIFVNPLQFGPNEDLQQYPRTLDRDRALCEQAGVDVIFAPTAAEMGIGGSQTQVVPPESVINTLCGRSRVGHFQGVATIVTKLLNLVQPDRAYFGQKDAQQLRILQRMVTDLNLPVEIVSCPIVREPDGLAYSSRNQYLTAEQREQAIALYQGLQQAKTAFQSGERLGDALVGIVRSALAAVPTIAPEYVELVDPTTLAPLERVEACRHCWRSRLGSVRLG